MNSDSVGAVTGEQDQQRGLVPKLRFPEFRDAGDWNREILGDLISTVTPPKKLQTTQYAASGTFPIIDQSQDFIAGWTDDTGAVISAELPLIVFGDHTCVLKFIEVPFAQGADGIKIFGTKSRILREYLYQSLQHNPLVMEDYRRHFSILKDRTVDFSDINLGEQQKVADCLSSIDALIAAEVDKLDALKNHKKGLMQQLFPAPGETTPSLRFPEFRDAGEWENTRIGDVADVLQGYGFPEKYQGRTEGQYPFYKVSDISRSLAMGRRWITDAANYIDQDMLKKMKVKAIPAGTTIFAKIGEAIRSNRRAITVIESIIDNNVAGLKSIRGKSVDEFIFYLFSGINLIEYSGGVVPSINKSAIEDILVTCPDVEEQQRVAACLSSIDTLIAAQSDQIDAFNAHKKSLMQQLFPVADVVQG